MAYCPRCRYEYRPGVLICPDCNETLVNELVPPVAAAVTPDDSWVVMGQVTSSLQSKLAKGSLDSNNIPSVILSSTFDTFGGGENFNPVMGQAGAEGNLILVPREFKDEATLILEAILGEDLTHPDV